MNLRLKCHYFCLKSRLVHLKFQSLKLEMYYTSFWPLHSNIYYYLYFEFFYFILHSFTTKPMKGKNATNATCVLTPQSLPVISSRTCSSTPTKNRISASSATSPSVRNNCSSATRTCITTRRTYRLHHGKKRTSVLSVRAPLDTREIWLGTWLSMILIAAYRRSSWPWNWAGKRRFRWSMDSKLR